jgi:hypothetical protein
MKWIRALFLFMFVFILSCNKITPTQKKASVGKSKVLVLSQTACLLPPGIDTGSFSSQNKVPDLPISPVTGGTPMQNAQANYERIQWCLLKYNRAILAGNAEFVINNVLVMNNATLTSANGNWLTLRLVAKNSNSMIKMYNHSRVSFLTLNANGVFSDVAFSYDVIEMGGNSNKADNNWILGADSPLHKIDSSNVTGVYIICGDSNVVENNKIRNNHHGVIVLGVPTARSNMVDGNSIYYNRCEGVSLPGYGKITNNTIYLNGWDCKNGAVGIPPIPGAGIYSVDNPYGSLISNNTIYDNNGHNIDFDNIQNMMILNNTVYNPGNKYFPESDYPIAPDFGGAFSISLIDISMSTIEGNTVKNEGRSWNALNVGYWGRDINNIFRAIGADSMSDVPFGGNSIISFCIAERSSGVKNQVAQNTIRNNIFIASPNGIGYFSSRNTGFAADGSWSSLTTNYFTLNNSFGSTIGSVRCGGNWYAADMAEPNTDDYQHYPPVGDWAGNDLKYFY